MVFPVSVFTKICIFAGGRALASIPSLDRSALRPAYPAGGLLCDGVGDELVRCDPMLATRTCVVSFIDGSEVGARYGNPWRNDGEIHGPRRFKSAGCMRASVWAAARSLRLHLLCSCVRPYVQGAYTWPILQRQRAPNGESPIDFIVTEFRKKLSGFNILYRTFTVFFTL